MRNLLGLVFCLVAITSSAQLKLGLEAGYDISQFANKGGNSYQYDLSAINGYNFGIVAEEKLSKEFFFQTGLQWQHKGGIVNTASGYIGSSYTTILNYLVIPTKINYKVAISKSSKLILGTGLYWGIGISGKRNGYDDNTPPQPINDNINFSNNNDNSSDNKIKPFEWGYIFNAGIEWKKYQFKINYNNSLNNIKPNGNTKFYNQTYGLSVAYLLPW